jgi:hypothetical protein
VSKRANPPPFVSKGEFTVKFKNLIALAATTLSVVAMSLPALAGGTTTQQGQSQHGLSGKVLDSPEAAQFPFEVAHVWRGLNEPMVDQTTSSLWQKGKIVEIDLKNSVIQNGQEQVVPMKDVGQFMANVQQNLKALHDANMPARVVVFPQVNHSGEQGPDFLAVYGAIRKSQKDLGGSNFKLGPSMNVEPAGSAPNCASWLPKAEDCDFVGLEGANFGDRYSWSTWQTPEQVFGETISYLHSVYPTLPLCITHACSVSNTADKSDQAQWAGRMSTMCQNMNVASFTYYSEDRGVSANGKPFNWSLPVSGLTALLGPPTVVASNNVNQNDNTNNSSANNTTTVGQTTTTTTTTTTTATGTGTGTGTGGNATSGNGNTTNTGNGNGNGTGGTPPPAQTPPPATPGK